jgi:hypothetical protein
MPTSVNKTIRGTGTLDGTIAQIHLFPGQLVAALKRMDENGFFAKGREDITLFISSSDDDEAFGMENQSAKRLNPEQVYTPFLVRYGEDDADES